MINVIEHPYWSYGPDHGVVVLDALAEGRRQFALQAAVDARNFDEPHENIVARAAAFEKFLKGEGAGE